LDKPRGAARNQVFEPSASKMCEMVAIFDAPGSTSERKTWFLPLRLKLNVSIPIAFLFLLIVGLPCQIGGEEMYYGSVTVTAELLSPTTIVTDTRLVAAPQVGTSQEIATDVGRIETTPAPLLTGLTRNRPSIWGSRGFYVLLGLIYVTLLGLFIERIIHIAGGNHEQR
jgi:hypothetical protein